MKKIILVVLVCALTITFFAFPVSAASSGWTEIEVTNEGYANVIWFNDEMDGLPLYPATTSGSGNLEWKINAVSGETVLRLFFRPTDKVFSLQQGDVVKMPYIQGGFGGWFGGASNAMEMYWTVIDSNNIVSSQSFNEVAVGGHVYRKIFPSGGISWNYTPPEEITFTAIKDCSTACLGLVVEFTVSQNFAFSMNQKSFTIGYGNLNSPEAPIYLKPDSGDMDDYIGSEEEILNKTNDGLTFAWGLFRSFGSDIITNFLPGLVGIVSIFNVFLPRLSWLNNLLTVSLAVGLFAFLFNLSELVTSRISGTDKYNSSHGFARGSARKDATTIKRDGIASHRPSRK